MGLEVLEHEITTIGGGAAGIMGAGVPGMILRLEVDPKQRIKMLSTPITKIRMQTEQGLWDEEFNDTKDQRLKGILKLIN